MFKIVSSIYWVVAISLVIGGIALAFVPPYFDIGIALAVLPTIVSFFKDATPTKFHIGVFLFYLGFAVLLGTVLTPAITVVTTLAPAVWFAGGCYGAVMMYRNREVSDV